MKKQRLFALILALAMLLTLAPTAATATAVGADYCPSSPTGGHNWVWEEHEPTCTEDGYACMRCNLCGATTDYDPIGALGHSPLSVDAKEPTCEESGWHAGARCSRCRSRNPAASSRSITANSRSIRLFGCFIQSSPPGAYYASGFHKRTARAG